MKYKLVLFFLLIINFACTETDPVIEEIQKLEFSREHTPGIFDQYISSKDVAIRFQAARSIARIQDSTHMAAARTLCEDTDSAVRTEAIFALGQIGTAECLDYLKSMYNEPKNELFTTEIVTAIGRISGPESVGFLFSIIPDAPDTIKALAIYGITFQTDKESANENGKQIAAHINHESDAVRRACAYYYSRQPYTRVVPDLLRQKAAAGSVADKYRLKAINRGLTKYMISTWDSIRTDSLRNDLIWGLNDRKVPWQNKVHQLAILADLPDSNTVKILGKFLADENPHLRNQALAGLSRHPSPSVKNLLLNYYNNANWQDKGAIINVLAGLDKNLAFRLIQQNLDRGTPYFKQQLLQALARIKDRASLRQLKQFLIVPNPRLNMTAFNELSKMKYIDYGDVQPYLNSGDLILTTIAAGWVIENPEKGNLEDLKNAFVKFRDPAGIDAMSTIIEAMRKIDAGQAAQFLKEKLPDVKTGALAEQIMGVLEEAGVTDVKAPMISDALFVPDTLWPAGETIDVQLTTGYGEIIMRLDPGIAPVTVTAFTLLAGKGFYDGLNFHRVVSDFVVQGGDPTGTGWGGPGYSLPCEYGTARFERGTIGMATAGKDTGGSQFFICHSEQPHLNRRYTIFGQVISGMEFVDQIQIDDQIIKVQLLN